MIEVQNLTRVFGLKKAVDNISFNLSKGDILGFLGPNGAGKSTTMRMLTGYLPPTAGKVTINGYNVAENPIEVKTKIGYLSETSPLYTEMTVDEFLGFCSEIRGFTGKDKNIKKDRAIEKCFLEKVRKQQINTLSKGYRQRVAFAQSILHDPSYLILDEPTDGLDPNQKHEVREMIKSMSRDKAIILSTHILEEAGAICNRAIIISDGRIVSDDTPTGLCMKDPDFGAISVRIIYEKSAEEPKNLSLSMEGIKSVKISQNNETEKTCLLKIFPEKNTASITSLLSIVEENLSKTGNKILSLNVDQGDLTEVFRKLTTSN